MSLLPAIAEMGDPITTGTNLTSAMTVSRINAMMAAIRSLADADRVVAGKGLRVTSSGGKAVVGLGHVRSGSAAAAAYYPFDIYSLNPSTGKAYVRPGTVNNLLPSSLVTELSYSAEGTYYLTLHCLAGQGVLTSYTLSLDAEAPGPFGASAGYPPSEFKVLIGVLSNGKWWRTAGPGSFIVKACEVARIEKDSYAPGEFPLNIIYTWEAVTTA